LAHRLQGLITAVIVAAGFAPPAAQAAPFSHKLHLGLKLTCADCHAAASSTKAADNNLPNPASCRRCHDREMPVKQPRPVLVTKFNHQQHARLGNLAPVLLAAITGKTYHLSAEGAPPPPELLGQLNTTNACAACHRGMEQSAEVTRAAFPAMQDCLVCHPKIDAPFSCEMCHDPGPHLKPASHVRGFMDLHSTAKANLNKPSCVVCHGRKFSCLGCH